MLKSYFWIVTTCYIGGIATYPQFHVPDDSTLAWQFASVQLFFRRLGAWDCYTSGLPHPRCKIRVKRCGKTMGNPEVFTYKAGASAAMSGAQAAAPMLQARELGFHEDYIETA